MTPEFENTENDSNEPTFASELAAAAAIAAVTVVVSFVAKAVCVKVLMRASKHLADQKASKEQKTD